MHYRNPHPGSLAICNSLTACTVWQGGTRRTRVGLREKLLLKFATLGLAPKVVLVEDLPQFRGSDGAV